MRFSFSLSRLFVAVTIFAAAFAFARVLDIGKAGFVVGVGVAVPFALLALIVNQRELRYFIWSGVSAAVLATVAWFASNHVIRPQDLELKYRLMFGALVGWFVAWQITIKWLANSASTQGPNKLEWALLICLALYLSAVIAAGSLSRGL